MRRNHSARPYLVFFVSLAMITGIFILAFSAYSTIENQAAEHFNQQQLLLAKEAAAAIEDFTGSVENNLFHLAKELVKNNVNYRATISYNWSLISAKLYYLLYIDGRGRLVEIRTKRPLDRVDADFAEAPFFIALKGMDPVVPTTYIGNVATGISGEDTIVIATPMYDREKRLTGVLAAGVNLDRMMKLYLDPIQPKSASYAWLLDNSGNLLYHPKHKEMLGNNIFSTSQGCNVCHADFTLERRLIARGGAGTEIAKIPNSSYKRLLAYCPIKIGPRFWLVAVETHYKEVISLIRRSFRNTLLLTAVVIVIIIVTSHYVIKLQQKGVALEEEAKDLKELLEAIFENAPLEICVTDQGQRVIYVNHYWEEMNGVKRSEVLDRALEKILPELYAVQSFSRLLKQTLLVKKPRGGLEVSYLSKRGAYEGKQTHKIFWSIPILSEQKKVVRCALIGYNVTELKQLERQLIQTEKLAASGKLAASIAHEINNPIYGIQGCLDYVRNNFPLSARDKKFVELSFQETERISKLLRMMHDFYHPSEDEMTLTDINELLRDVLVLQQPALKRKQVVLDTYYTDDLPLVMVSGDQMKQVFINLINNAYDAINKGGRIVITTYHDNRHLMISVSDNGCGIPDEVKEKIFEAFFTTKKEVKGVGLGLSVSYGIIQRHKGQIVVEDALPQGTTFTVKLPVSSQEDSPEQAED